MAAQLKREEARLAALYKALDRYDNALERANFRKAEVETETADAGRCHPPGRNRSAVAMPRVT